MKQIILFLFIVFGTTVFAQKECEYSSDFTDSIGTYKATKDYIVHEKIFGNSKSTIYFSLINADGMPSLNFQLIEKSKDFIPAKCFDKNSKIYFQLQNGKIITLVGMDQETCGNTIRNGDENIRVLSSYFMFVKNTIEDLKNSKITYIRVKYSGEANDYIFKDELQSETDSVTYYPENYFVDYLKCIID
jgi:hypothetical protein